MLLICYAQARFGINRLQTHQAHQPPYTLMIDAAAQSLQAIRYPSNTIKRILRVCLIDQPHYNVGINSPLAFPVVKTRTGQTNQSALTVNGYPQSSPKSSVNSISVSDPQGQPA